MRRESVNSRQSLRLQFAGDACYWQLSLTICTSVIVICPCSVLSFFMCASAAASLVSSFRLWAVLFLTTPVAETSCPTWSANETALLRTSHVLPSLPVSINSLALSPLDRQPVMVRVSPLPFVVSEESCANSHVVLRPVTIRTSKSLPSFIFINPP